jgi:hypothetical protein
MSWPDPQPPANPGSPPNPKPTPADEPEPNAKKPIDPIKEYQKRHGI